MNIEKLKSLMYGCFKRGKLFLDVLLEIIIELNIPVTREMPEIENMLENVELLPVIFTGEIKYWQIIVKINKSILSQELTYLADFLNKINQELKIFQTKRHKIGGEI